MLAKFITLVALSPPIFTFLKPSTPSALNTFLVPLLLVKFRFSTFLKYPPENPLKFVVISAFSVSSPEPPSILSSGLNVF